MRSPHGIAVWGSGVVLAAKSLGFGRWNTLEWAEVLDTGDEGLGMLQGALVVLLRCQLTSPPCPHLFHVLFQEESLGLGPVPGTGVTRAPLARVTPSCAPAACACAQLQAAWLASSSLNLSLSTRI